MILFHLLHGEHRGHRGCSSYERQDKQPHCMQKDNYGNTTTMRLASQCGVVAEWRKVFEKFRAVPGTIPGTIPGTRSALQNFPAAPRDTSHRTPTSAYFRARHTLENSIVFEWSCCRVAKSFLKISSRSGNHSGNHSRNEIRTPKLPGGAPRHLPSNTYRRVFSTASRLGKFGRVRVESDVLTHPLPCQAQAAWVRCLLKS